MVIMMVNVDIMIIWVSNPYQWSSSMIMFELLEKRRGIINHIFGWHDSDHGTLIKLHMSEAQVRHTLVCASLESISWLRPQTWTHHINTILYPHHLVDCSFGIIESFAIDPSSYQDMDQWIKDSWIFAYFPQEGQFVGYRQRLSLLSR